MHHEEPRTAVENGDDNPTLLLVCGKIAAGKSTLAKRLGERRNTVLLTEDDLLSRLYPGEIKALADYVRCSDRLKDALGGHIVALLRAGLSVVLDFPANTIRQRSWLRGLFETAGVAHKLYFLDLDDMTCKERLHVRNASGLHKFTTSDEEFDAITKHFIPPSPEEGLDVDRLSPDQFVITGWVDPHVRNIKE